MKVSSFIFNVYEFSFESLTLVNIKESRRNYVLRNKAIKKNLQQKFFKDK